MPYARLRKAVTVGGASVMANVAIVCVLAVVVVAAVLVVRRRATKGSACCGEHEAAPARVRVSDRNKAHYPHQTTLSIGGMTCGNCATRVENALNGLPGTWATVSIADKTALVRTKDEPDVDAMRSAVVGAGYVVL